MYAPPLHDYRAGIRLTYNGHHYFFTRRYFMRVWRDYSAKSSHILPLIKRREDRYKINSIYSCLQMSDALHALQRLRDTSVSYTESEKARLQKKASIFLNQQNQERVQNIELDIANRVVRCNLRDMYMSDKWLQKNTQDAFKIHGASYREMALFLRKSYQAGEIDDRELSKQMLHVLSGTQLNATCQLVPMLMAVLLVAEPARQPSVFYPTLMMFDLIRFRMPNAISDTYTWENCLFNSVCMDSETKSPNLWRSLQARFVGMPTYSALRAQRENKPESRAVFVHRDERSFFKIGHRYNGSGKEKNSVTRLLPSQLVMRTAGFSPMTHRFSFSEHYRGDQTSEAAHDVKSFALMCDWFLLHSIGMPLHRHNISTLTGRVPFDQADEVLHCFFHYISNNMGDFLRSSACASIVLTSQNDIDKTTALTWLKRARAAQNSDLYSALPVPSKVGQCLDSAGSKDAQFSADQEVPAQQVGSDTGVKRAVSTASEPQPRPAVFSYAEAVRHSAAGHSHTGKNASSKAVATHPRTRHNVSSQTVVGHSQTEKNTPSQASAGHSRSGKNALSQTAAPHSYTGKNALSQTAAPHPHTGKNASSKAVVGHPCTGKNAVTRSQTEQNSSSQAAVGHPCVEHGPLTESTVSQSASVSSAVKASSSAMPQCNGVENIKLQVLEVSGKTINDANEQSWQGLNVDAKSICEDTDFELDSHVGSDFDSDRDVDADVADNRVLLSERYANYGRAFSDDKVLFWADGVSDDEDGNLSCETDFSGNSIIYSKEFKRVDPSHLLECAESAAMHVEAQPSNSGLFGRDNQSMFNNDAANTANQSISCMIQATLARVGQYPELEKYAVPQNLDELNNLTREIDRMRSTRGFYAA